MDCCFDLQIPFNGFSNDRPEQNSVRISPEFRPLSCKRHTEFYEWKFWALRPQKMNFKSGPTLNFSLVVWGRGIESEYFVCAHCH